eukprot:996763-Rhodomonas_salina.1
MAAVTCGTELGYVRQSDHARPVRMSGYPPSPIALRDSYVMSGTGVVYAARQRGSAIACGSA